MTNEKIKAILDALIDTAERASSNEYIYNDKIAWEKDGHAFFWSDVYEMKKVIEEKLKKD